MEVLVVVLRMCVGGVGSRSPPADVGKLPSVDVFRRHGTVMYKVRSHHSVAFSSRSLLVR